MRQYVRWRRQNGGAVLWILIWLVGMAAILYFCLSRDWPSSQSKLQQNVTAAIAPLSAIVPTVSISDGRDITLGSMTGSEQEQQLLIETASKVPGVRNVLNAATGLASTDSVLMSDTQSPTVETQPVAEPTPLHIEPSLYLVSGADTVALTGQIKDQVTAITLADAAKQAWPDSEIKSQLTIDPYTKEANWLGAVLKSLPQVAQLADGELQIANNKAEIKGQSSDSANALSMMQSLRENLQDAVELVDSTELVSALETITPDTTESPEQSRVASAKEEPSVDIMLKDGNLLLNGKLGSSAELARVVGSVIATLNPTTVKNDIIVDDNVSDASWIAQLSHTLNSAKSSDELSIQIDNQQISVSGSAQDEEIAANINRVVAREFKDSLAITNSMTVSESEASGAGDEDAKELELANTEDNTAIDNLPIVIAESEFSNEGFGGKVESINTQGILFQSARDVITADSQSVLNEIVALLADYPEQTVTIAGYTDSSGAADANRILSQARADAVKAYLVDKGITQTRLRAFGYGEAAPIADNATAEGRALNRRIEFNY